MWEAIAEAFAADIGPHFEVEEQHLLPPLEAAGEEQLALRTWSDHRRLRALLGRAGDDRDRLQQFGQLLREHVRFEENELFPAAEKALGSIELAAIAEASAATATALQR
jgi:hemerythrin-like domain-containing protein